MNKISVIGLELAKNVFQVHGVGSNGEVSRRIFRCISFSRDFGVSIRRSPPDLFWSQE
jgi:hypothetical protein